MTNNVSKRKIITSCQFRNSSKVFKSGKEALSDIKDGSKLLVGGFGLCGTPQALIEILRDMKVKDLTIGMVFL